MATRSYLAFYRDIKKLIQLNDFCDNDVVNVSFVADSGAIVLKNENGKWRKIADFPYHSCVLLQHLLSQNASFVIVNGSNKKIAVYPCGCSVIENHKTLQHIHCDLHKLAQKLA